MLNTVYLEIVPGITLVRYDGHILRENSSEEIARIMSIDFVDDETGIISLTVETIFGEYEPYNINLYALFESCGFDYAELMSYVDNIRMYSCSMD